MHFQSFLKRGLVIASGIAVAALCAGCAEDEEEVTYADNEFSYLTFVGSTILAEKDSEVNAWYNTVYTPLLMQYNGLKEVDRYKKAVAVIDTTLPEYFAAYHFDTKADIDNMATSTALDTAVKNMLAVWPNGECATNFAVNYEKIMSWEKAGSTPRPQRMQIVGYEFDAASDAAINEWYNNFVMPTFMTYDGLLKTARYKKMGATSDINSAAFPTYLAVYYYATQEAQDGMKESPGYAEVFANEAETWKNNELTLKCVLFTTNIFTQGR
ncbi:MAG: hypothetical protein JXA18_08860 [Chitinispirillaceae bacterium]|nr:hypothetical protein [Chitinispirillaceae bacterium]